MDQSFPVIKNKLKRWGDFEDGSDKKTEVQPEEIILSDEKATLTIQNPSRNLKKISLRCQNPLVTQTVEVMHQSEMVQTLIDTYADKSNGNYVLNHNQILPDIDFPPETTANLLSDRKFAKPLWFIRPKDTRFTRGTPKALPPITKATVNICLRKSLCGLLKMSEFIQSTDSALVLFVDAIDHFYKAFMDSINETVLLGQPEPGARNTGESWPNDKNRKLNVAVLEKAYTNMTSESLTCLHNYYKNTIVAKNRQEIDEFSEIFGEYKKLQQESQELNRAANPRDDEDILGYVDYMAIDGQQPIYAQDNMGQIMGYVEGTTEQQWTSGAPME